MAQVRRLGSTMSFDALLQKLCVGRAEDACINVRQASNASRARTRTSTLLGAVRVQIDLHPSDEAADCSTTSLPPKADPTSALPAQVPPAHSGAGTALTPATSAPGLAAGAG